MLRLEGNTISPQAAEEIGKALKEKKSLQRFIGNDLFTGRLKDEIPLALVKRESSSFMIFLNYYKSHHHNRNRCAERWIFRAQI